MPELNGGQEPMTPLGDHPALRSWSGRPRPWGAEGPGWRAWFGGKVINGLCEVLDAHLEEHRHSTPAAIGCVPWFTSRAVEDRLLKMSACCVVIDKGAWFPRRLAAATEKGFPNTLLPSLEFTTPNPEEDGTWIGPYTPRPEHELGPIRVLGWRTDSHKPLLHAKILVLGEIAEFRYDVPDYGDHYEVHFVTKKVWVGSANWTEMSQSHLEVGVLLDDDNFVREAASFVSDVIGFSEPVGTTHVGPRPNLVYMEWDDAAMAEAAEEQRLAHLEMLAEQEGDPDDSGGDSPDSDW
jgi:hypothetical protein